MRQKEFDPRKFIDRGFEQELFEDLLKCKDEARILAIRDAGGMGKSHLLRQFQYRCRTVKPRIPVTMIALDQLRENSPLTIVQEIVEDLAAFSLEFPRFDKAEKARIAYDFTTIRGSVDLSHANLSESGGLDIGGVIVKPENIQELNIHGGAPTFTGEQQAKAQETSVKAFFADLKTCCDRQPVVIMLDAYERCDPALQAWLINYLLELHYFNLDKRSAHLLLVVAGRELLNFDRYWSIEDCDAIVKSVESLSKWRAEHVEECLRVHGFKYTPEHLETFIKMIEIGLSPSQVVLGMESLSAVGVG